MMMAKLRSLVSRLKNRVGSRPMKDGLEVLADFVDGEHSVPGVDKYELTFTTNDAGEVKLVMSADDAMGGSWGLLATDSVGELRRVLLGWRQLLQLEQAIDVMSPAQIPEIHALRQRLYLPEDGNDDDTTEAAA